MIRLATTLAAACTLAAALAACGGPPPPVRYYQIALPEDGGADAGEGERILAVERLSTDAAYDDARIVYRESPYRLDYYNYHRWSSPPGLMVSDYLRVAYQQTGRFRAVVSGYSSDADAILAGRLMAIEEVNHEGDQWFARVRLELRLKDGQSGELLWSRVLTESHPLRTRDPEGVAEALAAAMGRVVDATSSQVASKMPASKIPAE